MSNRRPELVRWGAAAIVVAVLAAGIALVAGGRDGDGQDGRGSAVKVLAVGDIGQCESNGDEATAKLAKAMPDVPILALGDLAYPDATAADFARCYEPSWGGIDERVRPAPGNHEYNTRDAAPYYDRYGRRAGPRGRGWYSYDLGSWHIVALNSNCESAPGGGCAEGSEQERWLRADLEAHPAACTLAYWHHPVRSSGRHGDNGAVEPLRLALRNADADVIVAAHDHHYERYAPREGLREWVVGTGGADLYEIVKVDPGSEARDAESFGLLELTLRDNAYEWRFLPVEGGGFRDSGRGRCG